MRRPVGARSPVDGGAGPRLSGIAPPAGGEFGPDGAVAPRLFPPARCGVNAVARSRAVETTGRGAGRAGRRTAAALPSLRCGCPPYAACPLDSRGPLPLPAPPSAWPRTRLPRFWRTGRRGAQLLSGPSPNSATTSCYVIPGLCVPEGQEDDVDRPWPCAPAGVARPRPAALEQEQAGVPFQRLLDHVHDVEDQHVVHERKAPDVLAAGHLPANLGERQHCAGALVEGRAARKAPWSSYLACLPSPLRRASAVLRPLAKMPSNFMTISCLIFGRRLELVTFRLSAPSSGLFAISPCVNLCPILVNFS